MIIILGILSTIVCFLFGIVWYRMARYLVSQCKDMKTRIENQNAIILELQCKMQNCVEINEFRNAELDYIYKKTKILPFREKKNLDELFGSNDYEVYPPEGWN